MARRGPQGRTHFAGTRRTYPGTSQGAPWGPATPPGDVYPAYIPWYVAGSALGASNAARRR